MFKSDPKKNTEKLFKAMFNNNIKKAKKLVKAGVDFSTLENNNTPLGYAIRHNHPDLVEFFLKTQPDIINKIAFKFSDTEESAFAYLTGIFCADKTISVDILKTLIKYKADINQQDSQDGGIALTRTLSRSNLDFFKLLIENNARVNIKDNYERTPLTEAIKGGHIEAVKLLLNAGADIHMEDEWGRTPLELGKDSSVFEISKIFKELAKTYDLQLEAEEREKAQREENRRQRPLQEAWVLMGGEIIAYVTTNLILERKLTDIFNFKTGQNIALTENLNTGIEVMSTPVPLQTLPENTISDAFEQLEKLGGSTKNKPSNVKAKQNGFKL